VIRLVGMNSPHHAVEGGHSKHSSFPSSIQRVPLNHNNNATATAVSDDVIISQPCSSSRHINEDVRTSGCHSQTSDSYVTTVCIPENYEPSSLSSSPCSAVSNDTLEVPQQRRKFSLMPPLTEEDIKNGQIGQMDAASVVELLGEDFATRFCIPSPKIQSVPVSPLPYDTEEKMICHPLTQPLPYEVRDENIPRGVPVVKVRRRVPFNNPRVNGTANVASMTEPFEEVSIVLSPINPPFKSTPFASTSYDNSAEFLPNGKVTGAENKQNNRQKNAHRIPYNAYFSDIAASNPDMVHFQVLINDWIKRQSRSLGVAFILDSVDMGYCFCQVCGDKLLEEPEICGDRDILHSLFDDRPENIVLNYNNALTAVDPPPVLLNVDSLPTVIKDILLFTDILGVI
jgi:hypothetical protein